MQTSSVSGSLQVTVPLLSNAMSEYPYLLEYGMPLYHLRSSIVIKLYCRICCNCTEQKSHPWFIQFHQIVHYYYKIILWSVV